jgi:hypothetical protein
MHNFNGTMAIIAGLNWSSVHRLTWTRREVSPGLLRVGNSNSLKWLIYFQLLFLSTNFSELGRNGKNPKQ